ncbi:DDE-type integrase/transposase/recombinase [Anaerotalea alkaliphila]|uniref:Transposase family protein n=1 Tax=Anaerotalea alkaliphila TaxID=2662126 RepID=A0A7X5HTS0_9FIRM|nr:DDE-type integrase/transposase/recombinase [Anaerotalea alkaliphila]NDL66400.1 transposase family protein [Anaerotalea alkaliphila]
MTTDTENWRDEAALNRHQMISPLLDETLDPQKRQMLRERQAEKYGCSVRSIQRYEHAYRKNGFSGLKPCPQKRKPSPKLPADFGELVQEAILLKREVPTRSVQQIIRILEMEGRVEPGILTRPTLQRYLYNAGFGKKQMRRYVEAKNNGAGRFAKPHRMMLIQADLKYGPKLPIGKNGAKVQTYLSAAIDDCTRYIVASGFYDNQEATIVEDTFRKAILKHGKFDAAYLDNGKQYVSRQLRTSCAKLGIRLIHHKPYTAKSKGKIEKFNDSVNAFIAETKAAKVKTLEELNRLWQIWLDAYYHDSPHSALGEGVSPAMAFNRDSRHLTFLDVGLVAEAFLHHETRMVDREQPRWASDLFSARATSPGSAGARPPQLLLNRQETLDKAYASGRTSRSAGPLPCRRAARIEPHRGE